MEADFCIEALEEALAKRGAGHLQQRTGIQFTSVDFTGVLLKHGVAISMDGRGALISGSKSGHSKRSIISATTDRDRSCCNPQEFLHMKLEAIRRKDRTMKRSRFTEEQIIGVLREQEAGLSTAEVCRKHGISTATFYGWKAKFGGLEVSEAKRLKQLEDENAKLKRLLADAMLDNAALKDLMTKKF